MTIGNFLIQLLLFLPALALMVGFPWLVLRLVRRGRPSMTPLPITEDGVGGKVVPLVAAFAGMSALPWVALASNNRNPRLVITSTGITTKVIRQQDHRWATITEVDVKTLGATVNLIFTFADSAFTFTGNVGSTILARQVLTLLAGRVPLSDRARTVLSGTE